MCIRSLPDKWPVQWFLAVPRRPPQRPQSAAVPSPGCRRRSGRSRSTRGTGRCELRWTSPGEHFSQSRFQLFQPANKQQNIKNFRNRNSFWEADFDQEKKNQGTNENHLGAKY